MFEIYFNIQSYSGRLEGSALRQWSHEYMRSLALSDNPTGRKDCRIHNRMNELIRQSGLVLDTHTRRDLHLSAWSPGKYPVLPFADLKRVGTNVLTIQIHKEQR